MKNDNPGLYFPELLLVNGVFQPGCLFIPVGIKISKIAVFNIRIRFVFSPIKDQKCCISLFCSKIKASFEREENVVNPPQTPIVRNIRHSGDIIFPLSDMPKNMPTRKLPIILTKKVAQGKIVVQFICKYLKIKNLRIVPMKPPKPTIRIDFAINN